MRLSLIVPAVLVAFAAQGVPPPPPPLPTQPPRDTARRPPPEPTGTAVIRGRVVASDTGSPIRKANVNLLPAPTLPPNPTGQPAQITTGGRGATVTQFVTVNGVQMQVSSGLLRPRSTVTDAQGMFEFRELPAGTYRLSANPGQYSAQYLGVSYGAKRPNAPGAPDTGQPIPLTDGQTITATIALPKGSVITGRVGDENGDPLARVQVYTMYFPTGSTRPQRFGGSAQTDDLGNFRLYGLAPGEYIVAAEARNNTFIQPNAPPETEEERIGMLTTYYPNSADEGSAQRVRTRAGGETSGIEIRMMTGRMLHISGMVVDSQGKTDSRFSVQLMQRNGAAGVNNFGINIDQNGHFQARNIPPGDYKLVARQMIIRQDPRAPFEPGEFAVIPVSLTNDMDDILITTSPGVTITGQIVWDGGAPPASSTGVPAPPPRVFVSLPDNQNPGGLPMPQSVQADGSDLTFTLKGLGGEYLIRAGGGANQFLKAVQLGGQDITDTPHEFKQGDRVTIVMTTRASTIEGTITDDKGPVTSASLVLFSEDKAQWRSNSIHTRRGSVDATGHFRVNGILPGRYFLIALPPERATALNLGSVDQAVFEQFAKEATTVTIGEDEQRQVDLKIAVGAGGY